MIVEVNGKKSSNTTTNKISSNKNQSLFIIFFLNILKKIFECGKTQIKANALHCERIRSRLYGSLDIEYKNNNSKDFEY